MNAGLAKPSSAPYWSGLREYQLVVYPDQAVYNKIMAEKQRFFNKYGAEEATRSFPSIKVGSFYAREGMEETLIRWMQRICSRQHSFPVEVNNYSGIPMHAIYLRVQNPQPFQQLIRQLKPIDDYVQTEEGRAGQSHPALYLSIAGNLTEQMYREAMPYYSRKTFHAVFMVKELLLQVRDHPFADRKTIMVFRFLPAGHPSCNEVAGSITSP